MPIVECPACRDEVTAPENAPATAVVRCPLCQDEFELAEVLDKVPPALIIVSGGDPEPIATSESSESSSDAPSFEFAEQAAPSAQSVKSKSTTSQRTSRRPKRKQANPIWEVVKVAGGGVIGLSMGQLILWWAFHRDPAVLAPKIPASMQWVLPAALRTGGGEAEEPSTAGGGSSNVGSFSMGEPSFPTSGTGDSAGGGYDETPSPPEPVAPPDPGLSNSGPGGLAELNPRKNDRQKKNGGTQAAVAKTYTVSVRNSPSFAPRDLAKAIDDAQQALDNWRDAKANTRDVNSASRKLYADFAQLAHTVTFVDAAVPLNRQLAEKAQNLTSALPEDAAKMFGAATDSWIRKRTNDGVALFGSVTRIQEQGKLYETIVKLTDRSQRRISVISGQDPSSRFQVGDRVLVLGEIIEQPDERIDGYEGIAPMVVLGGLPVKFPAKPKQKPKATEPEPKNSEPEPKATEPKATEPKATEPKATEPKATEPKATEPEPKTTEPEPKTTEPKPKTTEPEPKTTEPEPKTTEPEPKATEPEPKTTEPEPKSTEPPAPATPQPS